jgi:hypothetical protein
MCHLQPGTLVSTFDVEAFVCLAAVENRLQYMCQFLVPLRKGKWEMEGRSVLGIHQRRTL